MKDKSLKKSINKQLRKQNKTKIDFHWFFVILLTSFIISLCFSFFSEEVLTNLNVYIGIIIIILFIFLGIIFDMIGVACQTADEKNFHSMSSRRINGAKTAVFLKKNADKTSTICNDVIGDVCGIISGSGGAIIAISLSTKFKIDVLLVTLIITSLVSGLTVGGKALVKSYAINNSNKILYRFAKLLSIIKREK